MKIRELYPDVITEDTSCEYKAVLNQDNPIKWTKTVHAQKIRIYANVSNLCSFDNVHQFGIDPEITAAAAVVYPQQRTFLLGFNVTF